MSYELNVKEEDFKELDKALQQFAEYKKNSGMPDYSKGWIAYAVPLTFALLKSNKSLNKLTWALIFLSIALVIQNIIILITYQII